MKYFLYYCLFAFVVLIFAYINTISYEKKEPFTSHIRAFYRPLIRRTRLAGEGFYTQAQDKIASTTKDFDKLMKSFGL
jgi:hypothetical protein